MAISDAATYEVSLRVRRGLALTPTCKGYAPTSTTTRTLARSASASPIQKEYRTFRIRALCLTQQLERCKQHPSRIRRWQQWLR
jgi:hypothetical protein